jgi:hypothetical protein
MPCNVLTLRGAVVKLFVLKRKPNMFEEGSNFAS